MQTKTKLSTLVDHTNLNIDASKDEIIKLVAEAKQFGFNSICVRPNWLSEFALQVKTSAVISFPKETHYLNKEVDKNKVKVLIGNETNKYREAEECLRLGAKELDPVINLSKLEKLFDELDIYKENILKSSKEVISLKPIFSCEILNPEELEFSLAKFSEYAAKNRHELIRYCYKNSTGFIKSEYPDLLKTTSRELLTSIVKTLDNYDKDCLVSIKAAGGIRSLKEIQEYFDLCHGRLSHIGTSSGVKIFSS